MDGTKREDELQHTITYQEHVLENSDGKNIEDRHETKLTRTANENEKLQDVSRENRTESDDFSGSRADSQEDSSDTIFSVPKRYVLAIMMFCGFMNMYAIRVNLNVAIGAMVKPHPVVKNGKHFIQEPDFNWNSKLQGIVLGSFYYGYMFLQIPGGYFAMKIGGTRIYGVGVLIAGILTLFTPVAARSSVWALVALRVAEGLALGVMLPCNHQIWSYWAPRSERTILVTIALAGMNVGTIVTMPLTGLLTKYGFDGGWASVFYCFGAAGIVWWVLWAFLIHDTPAQHPSISKAERNYIERNVDVHKAVKIQWKAMLTSGPVWGVILGNIANDWGLYTILICLPLFLMDIMHFDVQAMGFIASLPFLLKAIVGPVGGVLADILRNGYMSTANVRRVFYVIGAMCAATMIVISGYTTSAMMAVASMCVGVALSGLMHSGYEVNVLDIAPGVSGIVMGISNTAGTITGFLSPLLVGVMTEDKKREQWQMVFWITFFLYLAGSIMFCILVSGEPQSWAVQNDDSESSLDDESS
ncbi:vesicular glutamate transporter 1-like [Rhopilema esculentum]|uniref:vesicular glutamate transporter 1-like n=1 Tax=Rhopilema esculentum TaxID=499914 RepID=UPI0031E08E46